MICPGCGGVVGRDCWNPQECEWISRDMEARAAADHILQERAYEEYWRAEQERVENRQRAEQLDEWWWGAGIA